MQDAVTKGLDKRRLADIYRTVGSPDRIDAIYSPTASQKGVIFHAQLDEGDVYVTSKIWNISSSINIQALYTAFKVLVERHEVFRIQFVGADVSEIVQVVLSDVPLQWREIDLSGSVDESREEKLDQVVIEERLRVARNLTRGGSLMSV